MTATLTISAGDATGPVGARRVKVTLTDADGRQVTGYSSAGELVGRVDQWTDADGALSLSLIPNGDITPANTYYTVNIDGRSVLISKGSSTQTVSQALAVVPEALGDDVTVVDGGSLNDTSFDFTIDGGSL